MEILIGLVLVGIVVYFANWDDLEKEKQGRRFRIVPLMLFFFISLIFLMGVSILLNAIAGTSASADPASPIIPMPLAGIFFVFSLVIAVLAYGIVFQDSWRHFIQAKIIRSDGHVRQYRADSRVHTVALVLALFQIVNILASLLLTGGIAGLAETLAESSLASQIQAQVIYFIVYLLLSALGVGLYIRRNMPQTLERLGLGQISRESILLGLGVGFVLFWLQVAVSLTWSMLVSPETLEAQNAASEVLFSLFSQSLLAALILAITTGVGEEILFRGALQPIFGNVLTSLFFTILHAQYTLTPASLVIFFVSLSFGYLRQRWNTSAAILAHFIYNLMPFLLLWIASALTNT